MRTEQEKLPAVSVQLSEVDAELVDGRAVAILVQQCGKLLDLLRGEFRPQLEEEEGEERGRDPSEEDEEKSNCETEIDVLAFRGLSDNFHQQIISRRGLRDAYNFNWI